MLFLLLVCPLYSCLVFSSECFTSCITVYLTNTLVKTYFYLVSKKPRNWLCVMATKKENKWWRDHKLWSDLVPCLPAHKFFILSQTDGYAESWIFVCQIIWKSNTVNLFFLVVKWADSLPFFFIVNVKLQKCNMCPL